jgi:hypothetical protein
MDADIPWTGAFPTGVERHVEDFCAFETAKIVNPGASINAGGANVPEFWLRQSMLGDTARGVSLRSAG